MAGRPSNEARALSKRLELENIQRMADGVTALLVYQGRLFCRAVCIAGWEDDRGAGWWDADDEIWEDGRCVGVRPHSPPPKLADLVRAPKQKRGGRLLGHWPRVLDWYEVRPTYVADIPGFTCRGCGLPFKARPARTPWRMRELRRKTAEWRKAKRAEKAQAKQDAAELAELDERHCEEQRYVPLMRDAALVAWSQRHRLIGGPWPY